MIQLDRRQFLQGLGGFTLALPLLPSLLPRTARAAVATTDRFYVHLTAEHGAIWGSHMVPPDATLTETLQYRAGFPVRRGNLALSVANGRASLSPVLTADSGRFTSTLASKMNVLRGLDVPFYLGHHTGGHLGNYARNDGNGGDGQLVQKYPRPTIDNVLAWSPAFYGSLAGVKLRAMNFGDSGISWDWSNPETRSGTIQRIDATWDSLALFDQIFVSQTDPGSLRSSVVDRVFADYQRLRSSNRQLSSADRLRLDDHMQRLSELQRKLQTSGSCANVTKPTKSARDYANTSSFDYDIPSQKAAYQLFNDVVVAAFACGSSRIATVRIDQNFATYTGDWHQDVAHQAHLPDGAKQAMKTEAYRETFEDVYLDLVAKLDAVPGPAGGTLLDQALVVWTQESGPYTHDPVCMPVVTAGSAGGALRTGSYCDYRNTANVFDAGGFQGSTEVTWSGLVYNQFLGTALQAMGLPRSAYETDGVGGYGHLYVGYDGDGPKHWPAAVTGAMGEMLPFLQA